MQMHTDKIGVAKLISENKRICLNLGGGRTVMPGYVNVDIIDLPEVDIVANLEEGLKFIPDDSIDEVNSRSFFEHITNFELLMTEIFRVLKKDGLVKIFVPHFSNPYYYSDYTHKRFFGYYSFYYFSKNQDNLMRKIPSFYNDINFTVHRQKLIFASTIPKYHLVNIFSEWLFNRSTKLQEIYEAYFSPILACNGLEVTLKK
jgi:predicted SAM-dependent methyltransferase